MGNISNKWNALQVTGADRPSIAASHEDWYSFIPAKRNRCITAGKLANQFCAYTRIQISRKLLQDIWKGWPKDLLSVSHSHDATKVSIYIGTVCIAIRLMTTVQRN